MYDKILRAIDASLLRESDPKAIQLCELLREQRSDLEKAADDEQLIAAVRTAAEARGKPSLVELFSTTLRASRHATNDRVGDGNNSFPLDDIRTPESEGRSGTSAEGNKQLRIALDDARLLLDFASRQEIDIEAATIKALTTSQRRFGSNELTADEEADFWTAFQKLNIAIAPISVDDIRDYSKRRSEPLWRRWLIAKPTPGILAGRSRNMNVFFYQLGLFLVVVLAFLTHFYLLRIDAYSAAVKESRENFLEIYESTSQSTNDLLVRIGNALEEENQILQGQLSDREANAGKLLCLARAEWINALSELEDAAQLFDSAASPKPANNCNDESWRSITLDADQSSLRNTNSTRVVIVGSILPFLYGLLGTLVFIVRNLAGEIRSGTFSRDSVTQYLLRLPMGMFAGLGIGFLFEEEALSGLAALTPLGLAFVAGYSVDLIFAMLDRIIAAFTDRQRSNNEDGPSQERQASQVQTTGTPSTAGQSTG